MTVAAMTNNKKPKLFRAHKNYNVRKGRTMKVACLRLFEVGVVTVLSLGLFVNIAVVEAKSVDSQQQQHLVNTLSNLPFIKNNGQLQNKDIEYFTKTFAGTVAVTSDGDILHVFAGHGANKSQGWVISESLQGSSTLDLKGEEATPVRLNYISASQSKSDTGKQRHQSAAYQELSFGEVYSGIELRLHARGDNVEKLFFLKPGASAETIKIKMDGIKTLDVNDAGQLVAETGLGKVSFTAPIAYQSLNDGTKQSVPVVYQVAGSEYGFTLGSYDRSRPVVIDPMLASAFVEINDSIVVYSTTTDSAGNLYIVGQTGADNFPATPGAYDVELEAGRSDGIIAKFDNDLNLLAATYVNDCWFLGVVLDGNGNVFAGGASRSTEYPTTSGAYDEDFNGMADGVIAKLDGNLENLLASTFIGGADWWDEAGGIDVDADGNIFVTGWVDSFDTPTTPGAYDTTYNGGGGDGYIGKFNNELTTLLAATFIGGTSRDGSRGIALADDGSVYIAGRADSFDFPTTDGAYDSSHNGKLKDDNTSGDVFVAKFDSNLQSLQAATLFGGSNYEKAETISIGADGSVYVSGRTDSNNLPIPAGAFDSDYNGGDEDVYIARFSADLTQLLGATYFGGDDYDSGWRVLPDAEGNIYISGTTYSEDLPTTAGAYNTSINGGITAADGQIRADAYVAKFDATLESLLASTYIGGHSIETVRRLALDSEGNVFVAGYTYSTASGDAGGIEFLGPEGDTPRMFVIKLDGDLSAGLDNFIFPDINNVALGSLVTSSAVAISISGLPASADITITGGEYSINGGEFTNLPGVVNNTDSVQVRLMSSSSYQTEVQATVTIGGVSDTFSVTTLANDEETVSADETNTSDVVANDSSSADSASNTEEIALTDEINATQIESEDSNITASASDSSGGGAISFFMFLLLGLQRLLPRGKGVV